MGNAESGFNLPLSAYLREIRRETNIEFRSIVTAKKAERISSDYAEEFEPVSAPVKKKLHSVVPESEVNADSVKKFLIRNPNFLDDFVQEHIAEDHIRSWLNVYTDYESELSSESGNTLIKRSSKSQEANFAVEVAKRHFKQRTFQLITRNHLMFPYRLQNEELGDLIACPDLDQKFSTIHPEINTHNFPYTEIYPDEINKYFINMLQELLGKNAFPMTELCYFLSTLQQNYMNIEYHNYSHGFSHAQSMYWMLRSNSGKFNELEMKSLMIASIAHDVGHFGVNEKYLKAVSSGLEHMYNDPIVEHHHLQILFMILQDVHCNIFCDLSIQEYTLVLQEIRHAIRSTDINRYKVQVDRLASFLGAGFDFTNLEAKNALKSLMMMTCDLCGSWKRWPEHKNIVWSVYKEFFKQGDKEMSLGLNSVPQMMRMNTEDIPAYQSNFLRGLCLPVFRYLIAILPELADIEKSTTENFSLWQSYAKFK